MSRAINIRKATREDIPAVMALIWAQMVYHGFEDKATVTAERLETAIFEPPIFSYLDVAEVAGEVVGFAHYYFGVTTSVGLPVLYLEDIHVAESVRDTGVGRALFVHLAKLAQQNNCHGIEWGVLEWNEAAITFYKRMGAKLFETFRLYQLDEAAIEALAVSE